MNHEEFESNIPRIVNESDFVLVITVRGNELQLHTNLVMNLKNHALAVKVLNETVKSLAAAHN